MQWCFGTPSVWDYPRRSEMQTHAVHRYTRLAGAAKAGWILLSILFGVHTGGTDLHLSLVGVVLASALLVVEDSCPEVSRPRLLWVDRGRPLQLQYL
jgi:hypothetical protein